MVQCDAKELREFIANNFLYSDEFSMGDEASFLEAGLLDSVAVLQIILFLEERYCIKLADAEIIPENLDSIQSLKCFVERKLNGKYNNKPVYERFD